ncbi:MAG: Rrf2 family transcriptional regulator [Fibrobacteres bacterium]|nr:Rrf2 family transcriptional regulator [Fibrobacterota bacterium]
MKVTTKTIYAMQILLALAERAKSSRSPIQLREIAETYNLPFKFLEQIAIVLKGAGWIHGQRGKEGGYILAVPAQQILISDLLHQLEGDAPKRTTIGNPDEEAIHALLDRCSQAIDQILTRTSLADLLADTTSRRPDSLEYQI